MTERVTAPSYVSVVNSKSAGSRPAAITNERAASIAACSPGTSPVGSSHTPVSASHRHGSISGFE